MSVTINQDKDLIKSLCICFHR